MMIPIIMNKSFERIAIIDDYSSFIWSTRYYTSGDFQLIVSADSHSLDIFQKDYYVIRDDDRQVGVIEQIVLTRNEDGYDQIVVSGRFLAGALLSRRIISTQTTLNDEVNECIKTLLNQNIINPSDTARQISPFLIDDDSTITTVMDAQYTGKNLLDTISDICQVYGLGFYAYINLSHKFVFRLYEGADRTYDQSVNQWVIFSDTYDNLLSSEYEENYRNIATAVLVAGEGEGLDRKTVWVTDGSTGIDRHEIYKDQRNIRSNNGEIGEDEYIALLAESGQESITRYTSAFNGEVYFDNIKYKEDVNVGDLCVIQNTKWGIYMNARLVEVVESIDETGKYTITPAFGV